MDQHRNAYFNALRFKLAENDDASLFRQAWERVVNEYAILRTRFVATSEGFVQAALKSIALPWVEFQLAPSVDLSRFRSERRQ